jgi:hypothetical protein
VDWGKAGTGWREHRTTGPTRFAGVVGGGMPARSNEQHGKPTREAAQLVEPTGAKGVWPEGVAEGLIVPKNLGNAAGGKEPWFRNADEAARGRSD